MGDKKKFGLVMPKKTDTLKTKISSIFNDENDDEDHAKKRPKIPQKKMVQKNSIKAESDLDPTIYEYDSIYDEMKTKQAESSKPKEAKQSRYIGTLLKAADKRKKEYERRIDRKIQIEREKEGDEFKDKEAFVTSTYKKKLQEKEEEEERERRENMLNDMMDVTKQKDLSGFYRHFLKQSIGEEKVPLFGEKEIKKEVESDQEFTSKKVNERLDNVAENLDQDSDGIEIDNEDDDSERDFSNSEKSGDKEKKKNTFRRRTAHYRDRKNTSKKHSSDDNASDNAGSPKPLKTCTRKSSMDSNSDASSSEDEGKEAAKKSSYLDKNEEKSRRKKNKHYSRHDSSSSDSEHSKKSVDLEIEAKGEKLKKDTKEEKQRNIYAKRTVGNAFAEAQARYFQRMALRNS